MESLDSAELKALFQKLEIKPKQKSDMAKIPVQFMMDFVKNKEVYDYFCEMLSHVTDEYGVPILKSCSRDNKESVAKFLVLTGQFNDMVTSWGAIKGLGESYYLSKYGPGTNRVEQYYDENIEGKWNQPRVWDANDKKYLEFGEMNFDGSVTNNNEKDNEIPARCMTKFSTSELEQLAIDAGLPAPVAREMRKIELCAWINKQGPDVAAVLFTKDKPGNPVVIPFARYQAMFPKNSSSFSRHNKNSMFYDDNDRLALPGGPRGNTSIRNLL